MAQFHSFSQLPEAIRLQIWTHVANFPRVVGTSETHEYKIDYLGKLAQLLPLTHAISTTRPPAILGVCREARSLALTTYNTFAEDIRTKDSDFDKPIYINPEVDIIYRGKAACRKGDAFRIRYRGWEEEPLYGTRILAVDTIALRALKPEKPDYKDIHLYEFSDKWKGLQKKVPDALQERLRKSPGTSVASEIAKCAMKGVREVMIVVGNDDDLSEVTLVPFDKHVGERSAREQKAFLEVCSLRRSVERYWTGHIQPTNPEYPTVPAPAITLMTVKRAPLNSFPRFLDLPVEIQYMILKFAYFKPRMFTVAYSQNQLGILNYRQPAVTHACHLGHELSIREQAFMIEGDPSYYTSYNPNIDTVCLLFNDATPRAFRGLQVPSIALPYDYWKGQRTFTGADAKAFSDLKEIVLLVGRQRAGCDVELLPILELGADAAENQRAKDLNNTRMGSAFKSNTSLQEEMELNPNLKLSADIIKDRVAKEILYAQIDDAFEFASELLEDMEKVSKKWKRYQRGRVRQGKSSPDWIVPSVRVAYVKNMTETVRPYANVAEIRYSRLGDAIW
jgi:hypothetical protein